MASNKRLADLTAYKSVLPYASELFGIYQPLLGWRSKRTEERFEEGFRRDRKALLERLKREFAGAVDLTYATSNVTIDIKPGALSGARKRAYDSVLLETLSAKLPADGAPSPADWTRAITAASVQGALKGEVAKAYAGAWGEIVKPAAGAARARSAAAAAGAAAATATRNRVSAFTEQLDHESSVAGVLLHRVKEKRFDTLRDLFFAGRDRTERVRELVRMHSARDAGEAFFDTSTMDAAGKQFVVNAALSPISVVHLFRQYFFELDSFLGTPVEHVWLSPGSSVELVEVHTRKTVVEKTLETALDQIQKAESSTTTQDEISEAVKADNQQDVKFGAAVSGSYGSIEASSSFDYAQSQKQAREATHKRMRTQTEKLSSEIRKSFKTTFRQVSEVTDVSSTKHVMANTTQELINYELRRKMRQVAVQVQDIGTYLCWQSYVDDPGRELGLARLLHIAKPAELDGIPHPEEVPALQPFSEEKFVTIPFVSILNNADSKGEVYIDGVEQDQDEWRGELEKIESNFPQEFTCPKSNYTLANVEFDPQGQRLVLERSGDIANTAGKAAFMLHLKVADFEGKKALTVRLILHWQPTEAANAAIKAANDEKLKEFRERERAEYAKAYVETVKSRVTAASRITTRNSDDLREEERIVVYRALIQGMLMKNVALPDDATRHVLAELINSIFDVDKMLYFVAPEWWRPRLHRSRQQLGQTPEPPSRPPVAAFPLGGVNAVMARGLQLTANLAQNNLDASTPAPTVASSTVGWGGMNEGDRDSYLISEESEPAKLGSSLGWLLQLDGDNMRNAFLNAPWVKAVIPIRPGKEKAAIDWLKAVEGMNGITDDVLYRSDNPDEKDLAGNPLDGQKMIDVIYDLAERIRRKHAAGMESGQYPKPGEVSDPQLVDADSMVTATPIDRVYEHGFFPLANSFRANVDGHYEIFDQWVEVLPTDQIAPVEVKYDPKTGRQV
jgi:hypothetical protein